MWIINYFKPVSLKLIKTKGIGNRIELDNIQVPTRNIDRNTKTNSIHLPNTIVRFTLNGNY